MQSIEQQFNVEFPILRDYHKTLERHKKAIGRLKNAMLDKGIMPSDIASREHKSFNNLVIQIISEYHWRDITNPPKNSAGKQSHVNLIKRRVNWVARKVITNGLINNGLPKSWATAFYLEYMEHIDRAMKQVTIQVIRQIWSDFFIESIDNIMKKPENELSIDEIDRKIKHLTRTKKWDVEEEEKGQEEIAGYSGTLYVNSRTSSSNLGQDNLGIPVGIYMSVTTERG